MTMAPTDSPEGLRPPDGRLRDEDRRTRKPLAFWDRVKFLLLLTAFWFILLWSTKSGNPLISWSDAFRIEARAGAWVLVLIGLEVLRQIHFLISEHWAGYHYFWTYRVFGGTERLTHRRLSDWTRFRLWRLITWVFWIAVLAVVLGRVKHDIPGGRPAQPARATSGARCRSWRSWSSSCSSWCSSSPRSSGSCPGAAWTCTTRTTSRPGSPTSGARTTCWSG